MKNELNAKNLKNELWNTLKLTRRKKIAPTIANAVAAQAREIMRVVRTEVDLMRLAGKNKTTQTDTFIEHKGQVQRKRK